MKKLIAIFLLVSHFAIGQSVVQGFTWYSVSTYKIGFKFPADTSSGTRKFPLIIFQGGNGQIGTDPNTMFGVGMGHLFSTVPTAFPDSMIYVMILPQTASTLEQPNELITCMDYITSRTTRSDTTNWCLSGLSQGAINTIDCIGWPSAATDPGLVSFGSANNYHFNRFRYVLSASICSQRTNTQYSKFANKQFRIFGGSADGTCSPSFSTTLNTDLLAAGSHGYSYIISGGTHSNNVWDSAWSPFGTDSAHNIYLAMQRKGATVPVLKQARVFDWFEGMWGTYDENQPMNYFDGQKNTGGGNAWDPGNGITTDTTSVGNPAHGFLSTKGGPTFPYGDYGFVNRGGDSVNWNGIYYKGYRSAVTFDLTGRKDVRDTSGQFLITDIYAKDGEEAGIGTIFYRFDPVFKVSDTLKSWYIARSDSLMVPFDSLVTTGDGGIIHHTFSTPIPARYIRAIVKSNSSLHVSNFYEIAFYGNYNYDTAALRDSVRPEYTAPIPLLKGVTNTVDKRSGIGVFNGEGLYSLQAHVPIRANTNLSYTDTATAQGIPTKFKFWETTSGDFTIPKLQWYKANGKEVWFTNQGGSAYNGADSVFAGLRYTRVNLDFVGKEPEWPGNHKRDSTYWSEITKVLGRTTTGTNKFSTTVSNGQDLVRVQELGNEITQAFLSYHATYIRDRKARQAIKNIDPLMQVMNAGLIDPDVQALKTIWWYGRLEAPNEPFIYDVVNVHKYFSTTDYLGGVKRSYAEQVGMFSEQPNWVYGSNVGYRKYWDGITRGIYKYVPGIDIYLSENGRSGNGSQGTTQAEVTTRATHNGLNEVYPTPSIAGEDSTKIKAKWNLWERIWIQFTHIKRTNKYASANQLSGSTQWPDLFFAYGEGSDKSSSDPFELTTFFPDFYLTASGTSLLAGYEPDSVIQDGGRFGLTILKFRNVAHTDSVKYIYGYNSKTGATGTVSIPVPGLTAGQRQTPSYVAVTPDLNSISVSSGSTSVPASEMPQAIAGLEVVGTPPSCTTNLLPANGSTVAGTTTATLTWNSAATATSYQVWIDGALVTAQGATTYNAFGFTAGTTHSFYIVPVNVSGNATGCSGSATTFTMASAAGPVYYLRVNRR